MRDAIGHRRIAAVAVPGQSSSDQGLGFAASRTPPDRRRWWRIGGILFLVAAESALYAFSYPFFSLALEKRELASWLIGLNASIAGAGILLVGPFLPRLILVIGLRKLVAGLFGLSLLCFAALLLFDHVVFWFLSRFVMGACFAALWTTTEIWLNGTVAEAHRGRVMSAAMVLYAGAQFIGPLMLTATGASGRLPLIAAMVPLALAFVVALSIRSTARQVEDPHPGNAESLWLSVSLAGPLIAAAFLSGLAATAIQSLLPIFGVAHDLSDAQSSQLVAVFSLGEAALVGVFGFAADRYGRRPILRFCAIPCIALAAILPFTAHNVAILGPVLFTAGGAIAGVYALGVILIGQDFRGQRLAVVSTGFAMACSAGAVVGATPIGFLIDAFGANAFPVALAVSFLGLAISVSLKSKTAPHSAEPAVADRVAARARPGRLPGNEGELVYAEKAAVSELQMRNDRQRKESNLEEWFRQRAAEIARGAAERQKARSDSLDGFEAHQAS